MLHLIVGILLLTIQIWIILNVAQSDEPPWSKVFWMAFVIILPPIGVPVWYFLGPKGNFDE